MATTPPRLAPAARLSETELPALDPDSPLWPAHTATVGGVDLTVRHTPPTSGDAEPALMVHGLGGSSTNWTDLAWLLRPWLDAEAIDLPGHGHSGPAPERDYSQRALTRIVVGYLEASGRGPVHLVGNSMGGAIAAAVAARRPDLVRTLTLISPAVPDVRLRLYPLKANPTMALGVIPGVGEWGVRRMSRVPLENQVRGTIAVCFADPSRYPANRMAQEVDEARGRAGLPWAGEAMLRAMRGLARVQFLGARSTWAAIRTIAAPTLVLWGDTDRLVAPDLAGVLAAAVANGRVRVLTHIGHTAMMEDPVTSARAVLGLLEDAGPRNG